MKETEQNDTRNKQDERRLKKLDYKKIYNRIETKKNSNLNFERVKAMRSNDTKTETKCIILKNLILGIGLLFFIGKENILIPE